jgi:SEL1 protein
MGGARISRTIGGRHAAAVDSKGWAREALLVSAEMGSTEARLAVGDRILHGRGAGDKEGNGPNCDAALEWIRPVADQAAKDAEAGGDLQLPRAAGRLRERERDARWVSEEELENGDEQIHMEEDMAARGVPEAQRHVGYRRLVGRGVERDEVAALREFEAAAANGDAMAAFNLGYMHMKGLSVPRNHTEARQRFNAAAAKDLPAAFNGIGVLHFNGWGTDKNYTAARLSFEQGANRGDPDSHFNLGALHAAGLGVAQNQTKAVEFYEAASQAGHWRAPHVLAVAHQTGHGVLRNCTRAAQLFRVFVEERLGWSRDQEEAMDVLDGGPVLDDDDSGRL